MSGVGLCVCVCTGGTAQKNKFQHILCVFVWFSIKNCFFCLLFSFSFISNHKSIPSQRKIIKIENKTKKKFAIYIYLLYFVCVRISLRTEWRHVQFILFVFVARTTLWQSELLLSHILPQKCIIEKSAAATLYFNEMLAAAAAVPMQMVNDKIK